MEFTREVIRKFARESEIEIPKELMDKIIELHMDSSRKFMEEKVKESVSEHKAKAEAVQKELNELKKQVEADAKEREGKDYDALKKEFDAYKQEQERKETRTAKENAYKEILKDAGIAEKHYAKILKYSDVDGIELDEKGEIKDRKNILKSIKEEWSDHIGQQNVSGANVSNPPANTGGGVKTAEEIMKIENKSERRKAMRENPDLFGL